MVVYLNSKAIPYLIDGLLEVTVCDAALYMKAVSISVLALVSRPLGVTADDRSDLVSICPKRRPPFFAACYR